MKPLPTSHKAVCVPAPILPVRHPAVAPWQVAGSGSVVCASAPHVHTAPAGGSAAGLGLTLSQLSQAFEK